MPPNGSLLDWAWQRWILADRPLSGERYYTLRLIIKLQRFIG